MGNAFIVGDVHGNYPKLKAALQTYGYREGDDVIFVGNLMDRGYYNAKKDTSFRVTMNSSTGI